MKILSNYNFSKINNIKFGSSVENRNDYKNKEAKDKLLQEETNQTIPIGLKEASALRAQVLTGKNKAVGFVDLGKIKTNFDRDLYCYKLNNGQHVYIMPKKGPTIVKTYIKTGSMNEEDNKRGISHFVEHNLFNGSKNIKPGVFFNKVSEMGGNTNASTNFAQTDYYIESQLLKDDDLAKTIELHSDMLQNPLFDYEQMIKERGPVTSEIAMVEDDPFNISVNECIRNLYQIKTTSKDLVAGTIDNINNITKEDLTSYFEQNYSPCNMVTVITGDVNPNETIKLVASKFNKKNPTNQKPQKHETLNPIETPIRTDLYTKNSKQAIVSLGFAGPQNNDTKGKIVLEVIFEALNSPSSQIKQRLEEKQLNTNFLYFSLEKIGNKYDDKKAVLANFQVADKNVDEALDVINQEIKNIQQNGIDEEKFKAIKEKLIYSNILVSESSEDLNNNIGYSMMDGDIDYLTKYNSIVNSLTMEDIKSAANSYLNLNASSLNVVHPVINKTEFANKNKNITFGSNYIDKKVYDESLVLEKKLDNNLNLVINPTEVNNYSLKLKFLKENYIKCNPASTLVLYEMLNRGSEYKNNHMMKEYEDKNNINVHLFADNNNIGAIASGEVKNLEKSIDLINEILLHPRFDEKDFEIVKKQILDNLKASNQSLLLQEKLFPNLPFMESKLKLIKDLEKLSLNDVKNAYSQLMNDKSCIVSVSIPKNKDFQKNVKLLEEKLNQEEYGKINDFKPFKIKTFEVNNKSELIFNHVENKQAKVERAYKFEAPKDIERKTAYVLMNIILGGATTSRLFMDLREKEKLCYRVFSAIDYTGDTGVMTLYTGTTTDDENDKSNDYNNVIKSLSGFEKHINKIKNENVSQKELEEAKKILKTKILNSNESTFNQTIDLLEGKNSSEGIFRTNQVLKCIDKITADDIKKAANEVFANKPVTAITASQNTINSLLDVDDKIFDEVIAKR